MATGGTPPRRYRVAFLPSAVKARDALPAEARRRVVEKIADLADDPRPRNFKKLVGWPDRYRIRVGDYRVIYTIQDDVLLVLVVRVEHRRDVYRD